MNSEGLMSKVNEAKASISERDRWLLGFTVLVVIGVAIWLAVIQPMNQEMDTKLKAIDEYRAALNYISENQSTYALHRQEKEKMRSKLLSADAKIVSRLSSMASSLGFDVTVSPKDAHKTNDDSGAEEQEIEVTFKGVDYDKFLEYIIQIHKLDMPIYMRHLTVNRTSNNSTADTKLTVSITLMSYRLREQNAT